MFGATPAVALAIAACALAIAGCGGGSDSSAQTSGGESSAKADGGGANGTPSKSEFLTQADAVCARATKQIRAEFVAYLESKGIKEIGQKGEPPAEAEARQVEVIETLGIPSLRKQQEEIEAIGLPSEDGDQVEAYLAAIGEGIEEGEQNPTLLFTSAPKVFAKSDKIAGELGLKVCGNR